MADCKRKTANLFDVNRLPSNTWTIDDKYYIDGAVGDSKSSIRPDTVDVSISNSGDLTVVARSYYGVGFVVAVTPNTTYTISFTTDTAVPSSKSIATITYVNSNEDFLNYITVYGDTSSVTFTTPGTAYYILIIFRYLGNMITYSDIMLNTGSTPLPYEPYGWVHSLRKLTTATDTLTTLPVDIYADGNTATVGLKGNAVQNGTGTPDNPIMPQGTGKRTGNLFDKNIITPDKFVTTGGEISSNNYYCSDYIPVSEGAYYLANVAGSSIQQGYVVYDSNKQAIRQGTISGGKAASGVVNISANEYYIRINMHIETSPDVVMVNLGSTALPYEPYGYKIPISSASTTTPVYLGEVETTRRVKKYEFTGNESFYVSSQASVYYTTQISADCNKTSVYNTGCIINAYKLRKQTTAANLLDGEFTTDSNGYLWFRNYDYSTLADFKSYLAQQYAAGTPVTVWYVLAEPTTGIVNEPLMKIGDYADTVNGITVPTITGKDTFDVDTTLKPSEVSLSYTGWHDATVKEHVSDTSIADLESISISQMENYTIQELQGGE